MERLCRTCKQPIPAKRLIAMPNAIQCRDCLQENGDEAPLKGHMVWDHKTAPTIEVGTRLANDQPNAHPREPKSDASPSSKRWDVEGIVVNTRASDCHPDRPAISAKGLCVDCSILWYEKRLWPR